MPDTIEAEDDVTVVVPEVAKPPDPEPKPLDKVAATEPEKPKAPAEDLAEQFKAQQQATDRERERATRAERQAAEERKVTARITQERDAARKGMATRELETINAGINAAETEASAAEAEYQTAFDAGDGKRMAEAQRRMARAEARKLRFDEAKDDIESRQAEPEPKEQPRQTTQPADQFEAYLGQFTPKTAGWLREHSEWVSDGKKNARLQAAHYDAVANDITPDSDEYFAHVEQMIGLHEATEPPAKTNGAAKPPPTARRGPPAAPPASGARGGGTVGGNEVRLSKVEASAATDGTHVWQSHDLKAGRIKDKSLVGTPIGHQEFARRKLEMTKQGLYDRSYIEQ